MPEAAPQYKRILLKLSGEALMGDADYGIDPKVIKRLAGDRGIIHDVATNARHQPAADGVRAHRFAQFRQHFFDSRIESGQVE